MPVNFHASDINSRDVGNGAVSLALFCASLVDFYLTLTTLKGICAIFFLHDQGSLRNVLRLLCESMKMSLIKQTQDFTADQ